MAVALIPELKSVLEQGSDEKRAQALRKLTALFLEGASRFNDDHLHVFDDVFVMLIAEIESSARLELSRRLAPVTNSPAEVIRRLAKDDDIMVAGPVLSQSQRLVTSDLVEIASSKGSEHLYAISCRSKIEMQVTDILVRRGDFLVKRRLAGNSGAQISESGFNSLLRSAQYDSELAEAVALRTDIPDHAFRDLLSRATEAGQLRRRAKARQGTQARTEDEIESVPEKTPDDVESGKAPRDFSAAQTKVKGMASAGELSETKLAEIARSRAYCDTVVALSELTAVSVDVVDRLMTGDRPDPILILCKATGYSWPTARDIILARTGGRARASTDIDTAHANFDKVSEATAKRVVRFWQMAPGSLRATG